MSGLGTISSQSFLIILLKSSICLDDSTTPLALPSLSLIPININPPLVFKNPQITLYNVVKISNFVMGIPYSLNSYF